MVFWRTTQGCPGSDEGPGIRSAAGSGFAVRCALVIALLGSVAALGLPAKPVHAQQTLTGSTTGEEPPVLLRADEINQDQELGVVVARGSVEISNGLRVLLSDTLSYNQNAKTVTASGNVRLLEPDGTVIFAEFMELSEDLLEGTIENLRILLDDNARVAANGARRTDGNRTEMARGVYSPCVACQDDPERAPLWQVKAERVVHDQEEQVIEYSNAFLEMFGIPVFYTPYLSHPDPTVQRRSGFLAPSWGTKTVTDTFARIPYFIDIDDSQDITLDPIVTSNQGIIGSGEYRRAFDNGQLEITGSATIDDIEPEENSDDPVQEDEFRGHLFASAQFDLDETWRAGLDIERVTDKSYLRKFSFWTDPGNFATSKAYLEGFRGRNHFSVEGFSFQELRSDVTEDTPEILPLINYRGLGDADRFGGRWSIDATARALTDNDNADSQMISIDGGYRTEVISSWGLVNTFNANLRGDVYHVDHLAENSSTGIAEDDGFTGRLLPSLGYTASYPMARYSVYGRQVIEPIFAAFASPNGGNPSKIANVDSLVFETDYISLFDQNRVGGLDRVETGTRVVGGINLTHFQDNGGRFAAFLGNTYRFREDAALRDDLNLRAGQSDFVGFLQAAPSRYVDLGYRFNVSSDEFVSNRNDVFVGLGGSGLRFDGRYTFVRDTVSAATPQVEEVSLSASSKINQFWTVRANTLRDLREDGQSLSHAAGLRYEDECFIFDGAFTKNFFSGEDNSPESSLLFTLTFKTLGEVEF